MKGGEGGWREVEWERGEVGERRVVEEVEKGRERGEKRERKGRKKREGEKREGESEKRESEEKEE